MTAGNSREGLHMGDSLHLELFPDIYRTHNTSKKRESLREALPRIIMYTLIGMVAGELIAAIIAVIMALLH